MADLLVVEDNEDIADLVRMVLEQHGHQVRLACDGEQGLRALDERHPEAVLLDIEMPVLDGPGMAYRMFVENLGRENVPIILMSAVPDLESVAARLGTPYAIAKPFGPGALIAMVARALTERRLPRPRP